MEGKLNAKANEGGAFNSVFNCNKMRSLISDDNHSQSFTERFRTWLQSYTKDTREKIWLDIESYNAG